MPRVPHYQTTPFTIDPSARSTQTFAERYGISPPHSNENLYGNDYTIVGASDDKCDARCDRPTRNHKVDLPKASSSANIIQPTNNNNSDSETTSKGSVIKGSRNMPNHIHANEHDKVEQRLQVSSSQTEIASQIVLRRVRHIIYVRNSFSSHSCESETCFRVAEDVNRWMLSGKRILLSFHSNAGNRSFQGHRMHSWYESLQITLADAHLNSYPMLNRSDTASQRKLFTFRVCSVFEGQSDCSLSLRFELFKLDKWRPWSLFNFMRDTCFVIAWDVWQKLAIECANCEAET